MNTEHILDAHVSEEEKKILFTAFASIDGAAQYFKTVMDVDIRTYFTAPKEQQEMIRGHYSFAQYMYNMIKKHSV